MTEPSQSLSPEPTREQIKASRTKLLVLIAIAFVPILIAFLLFRYLPDWRPEGTTNQGELIIPPLNGKEISADLLRVNTWVLLQPSGTSCDDGCEQMLYLSRQVVTGLGKNSARIGRMVVVPGTVSDGFEQHLQQEHRDVTVVEADAGLLNQVSPERPLLFVMDPNGNIMMYYSLEKAGKPMLKDLKHLLKLSNIG